MSNMEGSNAKTVSGILESDYDVGDYPNTCVWDFLHPYFLQWKSLTAFVCSHTEKSLTYEELMNGSLRWAKELLKYSQNGVPPTLALICSNNIEYPTLFLGAMAAGSPLVPIRHDFTTEIVMGQLTTTRPSVVVMDLSLLKTYKSKIEETLGKDVKIFTRSPQGTSESDVKNVLYSQEEGLHVDLAKKVDPKTIGYICFSSGTTGTPKGTLVSQMALANATTSITHEEFFPINTPELGQETVIANLPLAHAYGLLIYCLCSTKKGCRIVELDSLDVAEVMNVAHKYKGTVITLRSCMLQEISKMDCAKELSSLKTIFAVGSTPNPSAVQEFYAKMGNRVKILDAYGATEMGACIGGIASDPRIGRTGKLMPGARARFVDLVSGEPIVKPNQVGEIYYKTPGIMTGYLDNPEAESLALGADGWFRSGDTGFFDEERFISIIERFKDLMKVDGQMVNPSSVEEVIKLHECVVDVAVVGVPDSETGNEYPKAYVVKKGTLDEAELVDFVQRNATPVKRLKGGVAFLEQIPRNHLGKVVRKTLRDMHWSGKA